MAFDRNTFWLVCKQRFAAASKPSFVPVPDDAIEDEADRTAKIGEFDNLFFQGQRGQIAFGQDITQVPSVITLFKGADLSTFLHESGHMWLEELGQIGRAHV